MIFCNKNKKFGFYCDLKKIFILLNNNQSFSIKKFLETLFFNFPFDFQSKP